MIIPSRRGFLAGLAASLVAAPALVRAENLMPISAAKLWTPPQSIIGAVKPIVGPIPAGWVECDGRWLISQKYPDLRAVLEARHKAKDEGGKFFLPDMRLQAAFDRNNGKEVGRYVIYAGDDRIQHQTSLDSIVEGMRIRPNQSAPADVWYSF